MDNFASWLKENNAILKGREIDEVAHLAVLVGFSIDEVAQNLPEWHVDRLTRTTARQREMYFVDHEIKTLGVHYGGKPDLMEQWHHLFNKTEYGRDFDEAA